MRSIERSPWPSLAAALAALALSVLPAGPASAGEPESKTLFAEGRKLREAGKCEEAIALFRRALETWPDGLGALRNAAECEEKIGRYAGARRDYWDLRRASKQSSDSKYAAFEHDADAGYARLEAKVARLTIKLSGAELGRVSVAIDGRPVDPRLLGTELEQDIGTVLLQADYGGAAPVVRKVTLSEGTRASVTLEIPAPVTHPPAASGAPLLPPPPEKREPSSMSTAGYVALGAGGLSLAATIVAVVIRGSALTAIKASCPKYATEACPSSLSPQVSKGQMASTLANVFGGVAIAGLGAGIALLALSPSSGEKKPRAPAAELAISPSPVGISASAALRF